MSQLDVELPDEGDNIIRTFEPVNIINPNGVAHEIYISLKKYKNKTAQIDAASGETETFAQVLERSLRVACHLKKLGITPNDIISPCTTNHLNTSVVLYAILFTGAIPACMDPGADYDDKIRQLKLARPKFIIAVPESIEELEKIIKELSLNTKIIDFGETQNHISFSDLLVPLPEEEKAFEVYTSTNSFDTALIVFSSGSTGSPKGICVTHYQVLSLANMNLNPSKNAEEPVYFSYASLVWGSTLALTIKSVICGCVKVQCSNFEVEKTWNYWEKFKASLAILAPQDFVAIVKAGKPNGLHLPSLKFLVPIGGAISLDTLLEARKMLPTTLIFQIYSQTEVWGFGLMCEFNPKAIMEFIQRPTSCGTPIKGVTYKIVDPETEEILGPHKPGELRMTSKMVMKGYYKTDSHDRFDSDGFLKTGDILYYDEEHYFYFVERLKDVLRFRMVAVSPTELELIIIQHPFVKMAAVIGLPSDEGDIITAVVVKENDNVSAEEIEQMVSCKVDDRKRLRGGVKFVKAEEIPFTPTGKLMRRTLRKYIMEKCACVEKDTIERM